MQTHWAVHRGRQTVALFDRFDHLKTEKDKERERQRDSERDREKEREEEVNRERNRERRKEVKRVVKPVSGIQETSLCLEQVITL